MLEVCIDSLESARNAINAGAHEIEICSSLQSGGLTPSLGLVFEVVTLAKKIPSENRPKLNVMIRCRGGDDFCYSDFEMDHMVSDVKHFKEMSIDGFVFGALTPASEVDERRSMRLLNAASLKTVTFSRAFDYTREISRSAALIVGLGFHRILTSGHRASVSEEGAVDNIAYLTSKYSEGEGESEEFELDEDYAFCEKNWLNQLVIIPGGGVNSENVATFIDMGCKIVHSSCRSAIQMPKIERPFKLGVSDSDCVYYTDYDLVREILEAIALAKTLAEEEEEVEAEAEAEAKETEFPVG